MTYYISMRSWLWIPIIHMRTRHGGKHLYTIALGQQRQVDVRGSPASLTTLVISRWTKELWLSKMRNSRGHHVALISVSLVCVCICLCFSLCVSVSLSPSPSSLSYTNEIKEMRFKILKPWIAKNRARQPGIHKVVLESRYNHNWWL